MPGGLLQIFSSLVKHKQKNSSLQKCLSNSYFEKTITLANISSMIHLPHSLKTYFFKTMKGDISIEDFEKWIYTNKEAESILNADEYLEFISLNYKKSGAKYELYNLLKKQVDIGEFETFKMLGLLEETKKKDEKLPYYLMEFYDLYCRGYSFLRDIGLGYGLSVEVPIGKFEANTWNELNIDQQKELLESFSPDLEIELQRVIDWLRSKKIILTGEQNELGHYDYEDFRTEGKKKSALWLSVKSDKKWWKFW